MPTKFRKGHIWTDKYLSDFIDTTTINGVFHVFRGRSKIRQILWGLLFIGSFVGCCVTFGYSFNSYFERPSASTITVITSERDGLPFPSVTICNLNIYKNPNDSSIISNETYTLINYLFSSYNFLDQYNITQQQCDELIEDNTELYKREDLWNLLLPKENNLIYYCGFRHEAASEEVLCKDMFYPVLTPAGICYTFNGNRSEMTAPIVKNIGVKYGLKLVLNIERETHPTSDGINGVKVIIHERNDIPRPNLYGISVPPGQNADIGVQRAIFSDETYQDDCNRKEEADFPFLPNVVYSQFACRKNELYEHVANDNICGCVPSPYRPEMDPYANIPNCTLSNLCCLLKQFSKIDSVSTCPVPCKYTVYKYENSYSSFPNGCALTEIASTMNMSEETVKDNFLSVNVFLEALQTTKTVTQYTYLVSDLLGTLGGNMGLFLGISIISLFEVLVLVLDEIKALVCPKKVIKKFDEFDDKLRKYIPDVSMSEINSQNIKKQDIDTMEKGINTAPDDQVGTMSNEGID